MAAISSGSTINLVTLTAIRGTVTFSDRVLLFWGKFLHSTLYLAGDDGGLPRTDIG